MYSKNLFYTILTVGFLNCAWSIYCPSYCKCHMRDSHRYVACVNSGIISLDLDIPTSAQWVKLSHNAIDILPNNVFQNEKLREIIKLELDFNIIHTIERYAFNGLSHLHEVSLRGNHLYGIHPSTFEMNPRLLILDLSMNPLQEPYIRSHSIEYLSFSECNLGYLRNDTFEFLPFLRSLNISHNQLQYVDPYSLISRPYLQNIDLSSNNLVCDHRTTELHKILLQHRIHFEGIKCDKNEEKFQKMIMPDDEIEEETEEEFQGCVCEEFPDEGEQKVVHVVKQEENQNTDGSLMMNLISTSFGVGMFFAYFTVAVAVLLKTCYNKRKQRSNSMNQVTSLYDPTDPSAPPPSYQMLFRT